MLSFTLTLYLEEKGIYHNISPGFGKTDGLNSGSSYKGGITLSGCRTYPATLSLLLLNKIWEENKMKVSWVEVRTGRSLTSYCHRLNRLILGQNNVIYCH